MTQWGTSEPDDLDLATVEVVGVKEFEKGGRQ